MSKGNLFLGMARGSVGDVTFTHVDGEQVARARNRAPKNPKTAIQLLQRVVLKTSSSAYSLMQDICNHSFQGAAEGTMSQAEFNKANIGWMRDKLSFEINSGDPEDILASGESNFAPRYSEGIEFNPYVVSAGSLTKIPVVFKTTLPTPAFAIDIDLGSASPTYQDIINALGVNQGDQITFLNLSLDDTQEGGTCNGFEYCRVILDPDNSDLSTSFISGTSINSPNEKNRGDFKFTVQTLGGSYYLTFVASKFSNSAGLVNSVCAGTVILSRWNGSTWARSPQTLALRPDTLGTTGALSWNHSSDYLADAVYSYMTDESSTLYLNQAGVASGVVLPATPAVLATVVVDGEPCTRGTSPAPVVGACVVSGTMAGGSASKAYKLAVYATSGGSPTTVVQEAAMVNSAASISSHNYGNGTFAVCLTEDGEIVDTFCTFNAMNQ